MCDTFLRLPTYRNRVVSPVSLLPSFLPLHSDLVVSAKSSLASSAGRRRLELWMVVNVWKRVEPWCLRDRSIGSLSLQFLLFAFVTFSCLVRNRSVPLWHGSEVCFGACRSAHAIWCFQPVFLLDSVGMGGLFFFPRASFFYIEKNLMLFTLAGEESGHVRMLVYNDDYIPGCDTFERRVK